MGSLNSNEKRFVVKAKGNTAFTAPGNLLFYRDETLFAQHFDTKNFELTGEPVPIVTDVQFFPRIAKAVFAASNTGLLVAERNADSGASQVLWFDRKGQQIGIALNPGIYGNVMLAPNGKVLASDTTDPASQNTNVWTYDLENRTEKHLTFDAAFDALPIWSPDGGHIVFSSNREHKFELHLKDSNGANDEKVIGQGPVDAFPTDWSRDGKYIIYQRGSELWFMTMPELRAVQFLKRNSSLAVFHRTASG